MSRSPDGGLGAQARGESEAFSSDLERDPHHQHMVSPSPRDAPEENLALDDAENPLQLLARASDLQLSPLGVRHLPKSSPMPLISAPPSSSLPQEGLVADPGDRGHDRGRDFDAELDRREQSAKSFFIPARANLDVGADLDPVELGLVTFDESESLFSLYVFLSFCSQSNPTHLTPPQFLPTSRTHKMGLRPPSPHGTFRPHPIVLPVYINNGQRSPIPTISKRSIKKTLPPRQMARQPRDDPPVPLRRNRPGFHGKRTLDGTRRPPRRRRHVRVYRDGTDCCAGSVA